MSSAPPRSGSSRSGPPRSRPPSAGPSGRHKTGRPQGKPPAPKPGPDRRLFGVHAVREAWLNPERQCRALWSTDAGLKALGTAIDMARAEGLNRPAPEVVPRGKLDRLVGAGTVHQGVALDADPLPPTDLEDIGRAAEIRDSTTLIMLDQVTDPHNIGAILRSAVAFGALAMIVTDRHTPEITGTLAKSASGAVEHVPMVRVRNLVQALLRLKEFGFRSIGLAEEADTMLADAVGGATKTAIVLGAEGDGLRSLTRDTCDTLARLPTGGPIGSLNVSNAAAVALYELARERPSNLDR